LIPLTLVTGPAAAREARIAAAAAGAMSAAIILEGLPQASEALEHLAETGRASITRIAAGCLCCAGNLVMRVTLNRILRSKPEHIFVALADASHIEAVRDFLCAPPYDSLLALTPGLHD
jgi:G3E family GTPase